MALGASRTARRLLALLGCLVVAAACAAAAPGSASAVDSTPPDAGLVGWSSLTHGWYDQSAGRLWYNSALGGSGTARLFASDTDSPAVSVTWPSGPAAWTPPGSSSSTNVDSPGLGAFYYDTGNSSTYGSSSNFNPTSPMLTRVDAQPQFAYGSTTTPGAAIAVGTWSARWIGHITAPESGSYVFQVAADDAFRLFIDGNDVVSNWHNNGGAAAFTQCSTTTLSWGINSVHDIRIEYAQNIGAASMELRWRKPSDVASTQSPAGSCVVATDADNHASALDGTARAANYPVVPASAFTLGSGSTGGVFTRPYAWAPTASGAAVATTVNATATNGAALTSPALPIKLAPDETPPVIGGTGTLDIVDMPGGGWNAGSNANTLSFPAASDVTDADSSAPGRGPIHRELRRRPGIPDGLGGCDTSSGVWSVAANDPAGTTMVNGLVSVPGPGQCAEYAYYAFDAVDNQQPIFASGFRGNDVTDPSLGSIVVSPGSSPQFQQVVGSTVYVNGNESGSFWVRANASDIDSGMAYVRYHSPGASWYPSGDTDVTGPLYEQEFSWSAGVSAGGAQQATATDYAGRTTTQATHTIVVDSDLPTQGSTTLAYPAGWIHALDVPVTMSGAFADATTSVASYQLQRGDATLTGTSCGTFSDYADVAGATSTGTLPTYDDTTVSGGHCYRYRVAATDAVGNVGTFAPGMVTKVDAAAPTATFDSMPANVGGPITVKGTANDAQSGVASVTVRAENLADPGVFITVGTATTSPAWTMPWDTTPYGGNWRLHLDVLDVAGNSVPDVAQVNVTLDNSPPTIVHTGFTPVTGMAFQAVDPISTNHRIYVNTLLGAGSFDVTMSADDPEVGIAKVVYPSAGAPSWTPSSPTNDTAAPYAQTYAWNIGAGSVGSRSAFAWSTTNVSSAPAAFDIRVDNNAPTNGTIVYPGGTRNLTTVTVAVTTQASDTEAGVRTQQLQRDEVARPLGGTCATATWPGSFATNVGAALPVLANTIDDPSVANGMCYRYRVLTTDRVSNTNVTTPATTVFIDTAKPTGSISTSPPAPFRGSVTINGLADDGPAGPNSGVQSATLRWENLDNATSGTVGSTTTFAGGAWSFPWDTTVGSLPDGSYRLHLDVTDAANNVRLDAATRDVVVDNSPPMLAFGSFVEGAPGSCQYWAGGASTTFWFSSAPACAGADFSITATASDAPGGLARVSFPDASMTSAGFTPATSPADDPASPYAMHYTWNAGATSPGSVTLTAVGNSGATTSRSVTIQRDSLPPTGGSIVGPGGSSAPAWWSRATSAQVAFTVSSDADSGVRDARIQRRSATAPSCGSWSAWTDVAGSVGAPSPYTDATITSGSCFQYRVVVADNVDNEQLVTGTNELHVDRTLPSGTFSTVAGAVRGTIALGGSASDDWSGVASLAVQVNGSPASGCSPTVSATWSCSWNTTSVPDGPASLTLIVTDVAGNVTNVTTSTMVDNTPPSGSLTFAAGTNPAAQFVVPGPTPKLWFNPALAGSATATISANDAGSGISEASLPALGAGWIRTPSTGVVPAPGPYAVTYDWSIGADSPGVVGAQLTDAASNLTGIPFEVAADAIAPAGVTIDYADGPAVSPSIAFNPGSAVQSGLDTAQLQRRSTSVTGPGTCDVANWSAFTNVGAPNPASPWIDGTVVLNMCYQYRLVSIDHVGNSTIATDAEGDTVTVEPAGLVVVESGGATSVVEGGATDTYTVRLRTRPTQPVSVTPTPDAQVTTSPSTLTFAPASWNTPQTVTVTAVNDLVHETTPHAGAVTHPATSADSAYTLTGPPVAVQVADNDPAGVVFSPSATSVAVNESGATTDSYDIALASQPTADVTISLGTPDGQVLATPSSITFTTSDWSTAQTVTVHAVDDGWHEPASHPGVVTHASSSSDPDYGSGLAIPDVTATVADDDPANVRVTPASGLSVNEAGATSATYTVRLDSRPRADVTIGVSGDAQANASPSTLVFTDTNWNLPQAVTVTAIDDADDEGPHTATISHVASAPGEPDYGVIAVAPQVVAVVDDDTSGYDVTPTSGLSVTEGGASTSYSLRLKSHPAANVTIAFAAGPQLAAISPLTFTPTNWNTPQPVTVAALDDSVDEAVDPQPVTITHTVTSGDPKYAAISPAPQPVAITDNDTAGIQVDDLGGVAVDEANVAATDTFTVVLQSQPLSDVTITPDGTQVTSSGGPLVFTPANWSTPQVVTVAAVDDKVDEAAVHAGSVSLTVASSDSRYGAMAPAPVAVQVADDDTADVVVSPATLSLAEAGATSGTYTIRLASQPTANVTVGLAGDAQVGVAPAPSLVFTPATWSTPQVVTVTAVDDPDVEAATHTGTVTHAVTSTDPSYATMTVAAKLASITDNDVAGVEVDPLDGVAVTEGGATDTYRVRLTARPQQPVTVTVTGDAQVGATPTPLTFTTATWSAWQVVTVTAIDDPDIEPTNSGTITHAVSTSDPLWSGVTSAAPVTAAITDDDVAGVLLTPAGPFALDEADPAPATTLTYDAVLRARPVAPVTVHVTAPGDLSVSPATLTFAPASWNVPQTVTFGAVDDAIDEPATHARAIHHTTTSTDVAFDGLAVQDVVTNVADNDTAGVDVSTAGVTATEGGAGSSFTVRLKSEPTDDVTITLSGTQVTTTPTTLTFTPTDWASAQTVAVDAIDDQVDEHPDSHPGAVHLALASTDPLYDAQAVADVAVAITDNDTAAVQVTPGASAIAVAEAGATSATYGIRLATQPSAPVTITVATADGQTTASPSTITFTPTTWATTATVTVTAVDDAVDEATTHPGLVTHTAASADTHYAGIAVPSQAVDVTDDDTAAILVSPTSGLTLDEAAPAATTSFDVKLGSKPLGTVSVTLATPDGQTTASPATLSFDGTNWSTAQVVTVSVVDDDDDEAATYPATIETSATSTAPEYVGIDPADVTASVTDDDVPAVVVAETGTPASTDVDESGATDTYSIVLATRPTADVTIDLTAGAQASVSPTQLTLTPSDWNAAHVVTVTGTPDNEIEGPHTQLVTQVASSGDASYQGITVAPVTVHVQDDDVAGVDISTPTVDVTEGGATATYTAKLTAIPSSAVTVHVAGDTQVSADVTDLTFTPGDWNVAQTVTVTATDDQVDEASPHTGAVAHTTTSADTRFDGLLVSSVAANVTDDDTAGVDVSSTAVSVTEGAGAVNYALTLESKPLADVDVTFDTGLQLQPIANVTFTPATWNTPHAVAVAALDDQVAEGAHAGIVSHATSSTDPSYASGAVDVADVDVAITDNDFAGVLVVPSGPMTGAEGGGAVSWTVQLTSQPTAPVTLTFAGDADGTVAPTTVTFTPADWMTPNTVSVTPVDDQVAETGDQTTVTTTVASADGFYDGAPVPDQTVALTDNDVAGVVFTPASPGPVPVTEGGATGSYTVELATEPTAPVSIDLAALGTQATASPSTVTFTAATWNVPQAVTATAIDDDDFEPSPHLDAITHVLNSADPEYAGMSVPDMSVAITDDDVPGVHIGATLPDTSVAENGPYDVVHVTLDTRPTATVTVVLSATGVTLDTTSLTFSPTDWNVEQDVQVTAIDDDVHQGPHAGTIDALAGSSDTAYAGVSAPTHAVAIADDDVAELRIDDLGGVALAEAGTTSDTFTVRLGAMPAADVDVAVSVDAQLAGATPSTLTFSPATWSAPQTVTVQAAQDLVAETSPHDGLVSFATTSTDPDFDALVTPDLHAEITDDDVPDVLVDEPATMTMDEADSAGTERVLKLHLATKPNGSVKVTATNNGQLLFMNTSQLTFTPTDWNVDQSFQIRPFNDQVAELASHPGIVSLAVTAASDPGYAALTLPTHTFAITDDDLANAGIDCADDSNWTRDGSGRLLMAEDPADPTHVVTCSLSLGTVAAQDVVVDVATTPASQLQPTQSSVTIEAGTSGSVPIEFTATDDAFDEADPHAAQITYDVHSTDPIYDAMTLAPVDVLIADDDTAALDVTPAAPTLAEGGATQSLAVVLHTQPTADVDVAVAGNAQVTATPATLHFTPATWNQPQQVTIGAVDDPDDEADGPSGSVSFTVTSTDANYGGLAVPPTAIAITDNDTVGIVTAATGGSTTVTEAGGKDDITVQLATRPSSTVTVTAAGDAQVAPDAPLALTFTPTDWSTPQTLHVGAVQDDLLEGDHTGLVTLTATGADLTYSTITATVQVAVTDDETAGLALVVGDGVKVLEGGTTDTYTVALTARPSADVSIHTDGGTQVTAAPAQLTFSTTNWNTPQTVTVTAVQDSADEVDPFVAQVTHAATTTAAGWTGAKPASVDVQVGDDDASGVVVTQSAGPTKVTEGSKTADTVLLALTSQPTSDVSILPVGDAQLDIDATAVVLTPTNWKDGASFTVLAHDDQEVEGDHTGTVTYKVTSDDPGYKKATVAPLDVAITDNDVDTDVTAGDPREDGTGRTPRALPPATTTHTTTGGSTTGGSSVDTGRTSEGASRTDEGSTDIPAGLGTIGNGVNSTADAGGADESLLARRRRLEAETTASRTTRHRRHHGTSPITKAAQWTQQHWKVIAPVAGVGAVGSAGLAFLLRADPIKAAQQGARAARLAADAANRGGRKPHLRLRATRRKRDEDEAAEDEDSEDSAEE
jgi:hypothetical protein